MLRVLIADDHPLFREALTHILGSFEDGFEIQEASTFSEVEEKADADLDIILLDLKMPETQGFSALLALRNRLPSVPIVIVSGSEDLETMRSAQTYGAAGFIPKSTRSDGIKRAVSAVLEGGNWWPEALEESVAATKAAAWEQDDPAGSLTPSELRILGLLSEGKPNKVIAYELDIKETTVKAHITAILRKLKVHSRTQAVLAASKLNFRTRP